MDSKLRKLERLAAVGDKEALNRLLQEHLRLGILKPVDPAWAELKKKQAQDAAKKQDLQNRRRGNRRMTPEQRKAARIRYKRRNKGWPKPVRRRPRARKSSCKR